MGTGYHRSLRQRVLQLAEKHRGFVVETAEAIQHQWPPDYLDVYSRGAKEFHRICRVRAERNNNFQIRVVARKDV